MASPARREVTGSPEALVQAIIETSDDAIFTCDADGRLTSWSGAATRLFGHHSARSVGRPLEALFGEHLQGALRTVVRRVMAGDQIRHFETEAVRSDGLPVPVSLSLRLIPDSGPAPATMVVVVRDVTEQVLAQATLAEVEARLRDGEALAHVGSWLWDRRTGVVQWSAEFHRIHGVDPLDFDGTLESYLSVMPEPDRARLRQAMEQAVVTGRPLEETYGIDGSGRRHRTVRVRAHPTVGSAGTAVGLRGVGQTVTDEP